MDSRELIEAWNRDLRGLNRNSYKFVLQLAILKQVENGKQKLDIDFIYEFFVSTYWDNVVVYNLRETSSLDQVPTFHSALLKFAESNSLFGVKFNELKRKNIRLDFIIDTVQSFSKKRAQDLLMNPISRLQHDAYFDRSTGNGIAKGSGWLYSWNINDNSLTIHKDTLELLKLNVSTLKTLSYAQWVYFLEPFNLLPGILSKLSRKTVNRSIPKGKSSKLVEFSEKTCFYCQTSVIKYDIDHFIPFAYVNDHQLWNLVIACKDCNRGANGKFEKLPDQNYLEKLKIRNKQIVKLMPGYKESILVDTYENCKVSGFRIWEVS